MRSGSRRRLTALHSNLPKQEGAGISGAFLFRQVPSAGQGGHVSAGGPGGTKCIEDKCRAARPGTIGVTIQMGYHRLAQPVCVRARRNAVGAAEQKGVERSLQISQTECYRDRIGSRVGTADAGDLRAALPTVRTGIGPNMRQCEQSWQEADTCRHHPQTSRISHCFPDNHHIFPGPFAFRQQSRESLRQASRALPRRCQTQRKTQKP